MSTRLFYMTRAAAFLILHRLLLAQAPQEVTVHSHPYTPPSAILHADTTLVEAPLTVRDSRGHAIAGLHASDFEVLDNGVPQNITAFSEIRLDGKPAVPAPATASEKIPPVDIPPHSPRFVTFFFDDFHGGAGLFVAQAGRAFIAKGIKPGDQMSIVTSSGQGDLDFTSDAELFAEKLHHLATHERPESIPSCGVSAIDSYIFLQNLDAQVMERAIDAAKPCVCGEGEKDCRPKALSVAQQNASSVWEQTQAQTLNTISAVGFAVKKLSERNGTRILVMNSAGFLIRPNEPQMVNVINGAVRLDVVIHAIGSGGLNPGERLLRESLFWMPMEKVTDGTGGHFFKNTNDLAGAMDLAANPEVTYLLAFNPGARDGQFHTLKIRLKSKRPESVQFRPGYFSPRDEPLKGASSRATLDAAVFSQQTLNDVPASVAIAAGPSSVAITITVDVNHLQFVEHEGRHVQQLVFLMTLLDPNGVFITGKEAVMDLNLTDEKLASLQNDGLKAVATLNTPSSAYQIRTIVREAIKGNLSTQTISP